MKRLHKISFARAARLLPVLSALLLRGPVAGAQSSEPFNPFSAFKASAEAWAMSKYGDAKPSLYTGAMHYSVPIYTYHDPDFTLPISLEYNFDGYRPSQHSGTVGYGWNLACGGVITRDIRGLPDEDKVYGPQDRVMAGYYWTAKDDFGHVSDTLDFITTMSIYANTLCTGNAPTLEMARHLNPFQQIPVFISTIMQQGVPYTNSSISYDLTPDIYHFSLPGHSGDFMFMPDGTVRVFNSDLPHGEVKVEFDEPVGGCRYGDAPPVCSFTLTLGDGVKYVFGGTVSATDYSMASSTLPSSGIPSCSATSFRLAKIIAPNGRKVEFGYSSGKQVSISGGRSYTPLYSGKDYNHESELVKNRSFSFFSVLEDVRIDNVSIVTFSYANKVQDECGASYFDDTVPTTTPSSLQGFSYAISKRLARISVRNGSGEKVEDAVLTQAHPSAGTPKMFLTSVSTLGGGAFGFTYDLAGHTLPNNDCRQTDHWGYWNGCYLPDIRTIVSFSGSRYSQMSGSGKDPNAAYARAGALTQITYPAGGVTRIEYEGHEADGGLDEEGVIYTPPAGTSIAVGGVRVKLTVDSVDGLSPGDTTRYLYCQGFLYHMPRYVFTMPLEYSNGWTGSNQVELNMIVTGYNADCNYEVSRDEPIGYGEVTRNYPDGSIARTVFSAYDTVTADRYKEENAFFPYNYEPKKGIYATLDYIGNQLVSETAPYITKPYIDRRNMRGRMLSETTEDAEGNPVKRVGCQYGTDAVHLNYIWWNDLVQVIASPWTCESPFLERETVTDYADDGSSQSTERLLAYNAAGQVTVEATTSPQIVGDTLWIVRRYLHETGEGFSHTTLPGVLRRVGVGISHGGELRKTAGEQYDYTDPAVHANPSVITSYHYQVPPVMPSLAHLGDMNINGVPALTTFTRDSLFRITRADLPGGAWVEYDWDENNIVQVRENATGNATSYQWKSLVGVTGITAPSGRTESADYDSRNRLWRRKDTAGRVTESYHYKLKNE